MPDRIRPPLAATLDRVAEFQVQAADTSALLGIPERGDWVTAEELVQDAALLGGLLELVEKAYGGGGRPLAGTMFLKGYLWRLLAPVVTALLSENRVPDVGPENVALRFDGSGSPAGLAFVDGRFAALRDDEAAAGAVVLADEGELAAWLSGRLQGHVAALISALRESGTRRSARALWGISADTASESFMWLGRALEQDAEARALAVATLDGTDLPGSTNFFDLKHQGGVMKTRVKNACCLYYRLGGDACFTCPRVTDDERRRRLEA